MLSNAEIKNFHKNGYLLIKNLFDFDTIDKLSQVTNYFIEQSNQIDKSNSIFDLNNKNIRSLRLRRIKKPHQQHQVYDDICRSPAILDIIESLIGPNIRFEHGNLNIKMPKASGTAIEWHQDWAFYPHTNDNLVTVCIMLDDCNEENGTLLGINGSHKGPIYDHHFNGRFCGSINPKTNNINPLQIVPFIASAGSISIHHVRLIHGSSENQSTKMRRILMYSYAAADAWPLLFRDINFESFNEQILRGHKKVSPKLKDVPVRMPLPYAKECGSIFEIQKLAYGRSFGKTRL